MLFVCGSYFLFFFQQQTSYELRISDWSSDVCSSDLVFMALMDPYGLTLFSVEVWGIVLGVSSVGFILGGALVAKFGLGKNPVRTLLWEIGRAACREGVCRYV